MAAAKVSTSLFSVQPAFTGAERLALAGYLARYRGLTREAYTLDLRKFTGLVGNQAGGMAAGRHAEPDDLGFSA
jgi:hypothetical protein